MIADVIQRTDFDVADQLPVDPNDLAAADRRVLARLITGIENGTAGEPLLAAIAPRITSSTASTVLPGVLATVTRIWRLSPVMMSSAGETLLPLER